MKKNKVGRPATGFDRSLSNRRYSENLKSAGIKRSSLFWTDEIKQTLQQIADEKQLPLKNLLLHLDLDSLKFNKE